nr:O-antigen ligase family protein [Nocardia bovistercoris]
MGYVAVFLSGSRAGVIAAVAGLVVHAGFHRLKSGRALTVNRVYSALGIGLAVVMAVALFVLATRGKVGVRADVWVAGVRIAGEHPLGVGPGRSGAHLNEQTTGSETYQHAHNLWLNYAIEAGVVGMCAVVAITVIGIWSAFDASRANSPTAPATAAGLAGFVVMNLVDSPASNHRIAFATAIVLAVLIVGRERPRPTPPPELRTASMFDVTMPLPRSAAFTPPVAPKRRLPTFRSRNRTTPATNPPSPVRC